MEGIFEDGSVGCGVRVGNVVRIGGRSGLVLGIGSGDLTNFGGGNLELGSREGVEVWVTFGKMN